MIRAVLDANVFASGVLRYDVSTSTPGELLRRWLTGTFEVVTSGPLITEIERTLLTNPYFAARVRRAAGTHWVSLIRARATLATGTVAVAGVASHPEDDLVLAAAVSAAADYLVTGDRQLLRLGHYQGAAIVSPRDFLSLLDERAAQAATDDDQNKVEKV